MTVVCTATAVVETLKVAVVCPAATVTLDGTEATTALLLERLTDSPPGPAGLVRVRVPVALLPPMTPAGTSTRLLRAGTGLTVSVVVCVTPL